MSTVKVLKRLAALSARASVPFAVVSVFTHRIGQVRLCTAEDPCVYFKFFPLPSRGWDHLALWPSGIYSGILPSPNFLIPNGQVACNDILGNFTVQQCEPVGLNIKSNFGFTYHVLMFSMFSCVVCHFLHDIALELDYVPENWSHKSMLWLHIGIYSSLGLMAGSSMMWSSDVVEPAFVPSKDQSGDLACGCWYGPKLMPMLVAIVSPVSILYTLTNKEACILRILITGYDYLTTMQEHVNYAHHRAAGDGQMLGFGGASPGGQLHPLLGDGDRRPLTAEENLVWARCFSKLRYFMMRGCLLICTAVWAYVAFVFWNHMFPATQHRAIVFIVIFIIVVFAILVLVFYAGHWMNVALWRIFYAQIVHNNGHPTLGVPQQTTKCESCLKACRHCDLCEQVSGHIWTKGHLQGNVRERSRSLRHVFVATNSPFEPLYFYCDFLPKTQEELARSCPELRWVVDAIDPWPILPWDAL